MSYYGQIAFNTNGGALLSKRNYINRKLDEIEQKLLELGWIEPEPEITINEYGDDEYNDLPTESAGALLPYRDKVNKKLDFFEEVIKEHTNDYQRNNQMNYDYDYQQSNQRNKPQVKYTTKPVISNEQKLQNDTEKNFNDAFSSIFG